MHLWAIRRHTALPLQSLLLGVPHLRHSCQRIRTALHALDDLYDLVIAQTCMGTSIDVHCDELVYRALSCHNKVLSKFPPSVINFLRIMFIVHHGTSFDGFDSFWLCLCITFLHHFFCAVPPWFGYHNGNASQDFLSGADISWYQSRKQAKWMQCIAFYCTNEMGEVWSLGSVSGSVIVLTMMITITASGKWWR